MANEDLKGHFIVCGSRGGLEEFLLRLLSATPDADAQKIVLVGRHSSEAIAALRGNPLLQKIQVIQGDHCQEPVLRKSAPLSARKIYVLSEEESPAGRPFNSQESDCRTLLSVMLLSQMAPNTPKSTEVRDLRAQCALKRISCEVVCIDDTTPIAA